jgi:hypothetical protein
MSEDLATQIRRALGSILMCWDDTMKPARRGEGSHVKTSKEPPMPISAHVLDVRAMTCSRMAGWCLVVIQDRDLHTESLSGLDVKAMADLLDRHADWLGEHEAVADVVAELEASAHELRQITTPAGHDWQVIGDCPVIIGDDPCGAKVRAYADRGQIKCPKCGTEDTLEWWMSQIVPEGSDVAHADAVIACVTSRTFRPISHQQLRQWASRRFILRHGKDAKGRTLYSSLAVLAYAQDGQKEMHPDTPTAA